MAGIRRVMGIFVLVFFVLFNTNAHSFILINEILADPPSGLAGDANGDGVGSYTRDEFVELFNSGADTVDLSGWYLSDAVKSRHVFADSTFMLAQEIMVIFGGGSPQLTGVNWQTASSGSLSLSNTAETLSLFNNNNEIIDQIVYGKEAGKNQSIVRSPEGSGTEFVQHLSLPNSNSLRYSPGYFVNEIDVETTVLPDVPSLLSLSSGLFLLCLRRKNVFG